MEEQRAHARKMMHEQAFLADASGTVWAPVIVLDISLRGLSFANPEALMSGALHQLRFGLPGSPTRHHTVVQIVHQSTSGVPAGFLVGAMFVTIDADTSKQIADFVSKPA